MGLFSSDYSFMTQIVGVVAYAVPCFLSALVIFSILKVTLGIRVDEEEEMGGLDLGEHGMAAYADFESKCDLMN